MHCESGSETWGRAGSSSREGVAVAHSGNLEVAQRADDDARGRTPGQRRHSKGGRPYKRDFGQLDASAQSNFTDPESQIMNTSIEGFQQCYNAQTVVDEIHQIIVATNVEANTSAQGQLLPLFDEVNELGVVVT